MLKEWEAFLPLFVRVMPNDYRRVLEAQARMREKGLSEDEAVMAAFDGKCAGRHPRERELTMGRPTGFLEFPREGLPQRPPGGAGEGLGRVAPGGPGGAPPAPGRPLHGLRDAVLPHRAS